MVDRFDDCEFWLPSDFLTDEDFDLNSKQSGTKEQESKKNVSDCVFGFSGTNSEMTSAVSSAESESDEDDEFITCLTHKMDHSNLQEKAWKLSSSPKSPLCNASGEFAKRQMVHNSSAGLLPSRNEVFVPIEQPSLNLDFPTNHPPQLSYQQMQEVRFEQLRRHQMMIQNSQNIGIKNDERKSMCLPVPACPPLYRSQQKPQPGTCMRAVFLGNNLGGAKKQCVGTGVFLPRVPSSSGNRKNKPSCSPVLIPDRVVHALNLNLEALGVHNQAHHHPGYYNNNGFCSDNALKYKNEMKKNHVRTQPTQSIAREEQENPEVVRLPREWTY